MNENETMGKYEAEKESALEFVKKGAEALDEDTIKILRELWNNTDS